MPFKTKRFRATVYASDVRKALENAKALGAKIIKSNISEKVILSQNSKYVNTLQKKY